LKLVADTSAWIEFVRGTGSATDQLLAVAIDSHKVLLPDLVYHEVLRGMPTEADAQTMIKRFKPFISFNVCNMDIAAKAAENYRLLRSKGATVRGTVDLLIATWCIKHGVPLLHADRDFAGFEEHLSLKCWPKVDVGSD
jgi:predicted nucleic acid-binding protein